MFLIDSRRTKCGETERPIKEAKTSTKVCCLGKVWWLASSALER
jgi:hypothetical protein